jgi:TolB-like protein
MMSTTWFRSGLAGLLTWAVTSAAFAADIPTVYPLALFPFEERGGEVEDLGGKVTDLLFANLLARETVVLVERAELKRILAEQELSAAGLTDPEASTEVGRLTGARVLVTGSVFQVNDTVYVVAKLIGTETSRVIGASAKGKATDALDQVVTRLAEEVADKLESQGPKLMPAPREDADIVAELKRKLGDRPRPAVWIEVTERHLGQPAVDPAAQTELAKLCTELGFRVIDRERGTKTDADVLLIGEAFSQFATRHGNFVSVKSRLELKAVNRESGELLGVDRQTTVSVDLAELIAAKTGLQQSAATLASRLLPKVVGVPEAPAKKSKK